MAKESDTKMLDDFIDSETSTQDLGGLDNPTEADLPDMSTEDGDGRDPAARMSDSQSAGGDLPLPVQNRDELNSMNPVMQQTRMAQQTFGLPSHVVPSPQQMEHVKEPFRKEREVAIAQNSGQPLTPQESGQGQSAIDPSMVATGAQQSSQQSAVKVNPMWGANIGNMKKAYQMQKEGAADQLANDEYKATGQTKIAAEKYNLEKAVNDSYLDERDLAAEERDRMAKEVTDISKNLRAKSIDPGRWYSSRSTGQKIGIAISAFLTGFGGSGATLKMVQKAIDNDIDAQKADMTRRGESSKGMMAMVSKIYGDNVDAAKVTRAIYLENIKNHLAFKASKIKVPEARSKLKTAIAAIEIEKQKALEGIARGRDKAISESKKEEKISEGQRGDARKLATAFQGFNEMDRALKSGSNTFEWVGDDKYTAGMGKFVSGLGLLLSGAAVSENERKDIENFVARYGDNQSVQKSKMIQMRQLLNKYADSITAMTMSDLKKIINQERNKNFKTGN